MKIDEQQLQSTSPEEQHVPAKSPTTIIETNTHTVSADTNNNNNKTTSNNDIEDANAIADSNDTSASTPDVAETHEIAVTESENLNSSRINTATPSQKFFFDNKYRPSAFTILNNNNDDLNIQLDNIKPNAIVRPTPRFEDLENAQAISKDGGDIDEKKYFDHKKKTTHFSMKNNDLEIENLRGALNRYKLRNSLSTSVSEDLNKSRNSSNASQHDHLTKRPLFITTVPIGVFLPPPKEPPIPRYLKAHVYAYSSQPKVLTSSDGSSTAQVRDKEKSRYKSAPSTTLANGGGKVLSTSKAKYPIHNNNTSTPHISIMEKENANFSLNATSSMEKRGGQSPSSGEENSLVGGGKRLTKKQFQEQIQQRRAKRETPQQPYRNIMHDRRVIRGPVFGAQQLLENSDPFDKAAEIRRHHAIRKQSRNQRKILGTPPPVNGRKHEVIQTEKYLEELVQRPAELSVTTQTDLFLQRPPEPPYIPAKVGVDVATEIEEGELFHFDAEVEPIIDILVDACIEHSILEVAHEQEIAALRQKQAEFIAKREAELAELRRLEAEELRLQAEKERRLQQEAIAKELHEEMQRSVTAAKLLQGHIAGLLPEVLDNLEPASDAAKKEHLMKTVGPWLSAEIAEEVGHIVDSREILTAIIKEIIKQRATVYAGYEEDMPLETVIERGEDVMDEEETVATEKEEEEVCVRELNDVNSVEKAPEKFDDDGSMNV